MATVCEQYRTRRELEEALSVLGDGLCAYCFAPAEGNYSIHRDGFDQGPEVPLCDACGSEPVPTCLMIWEALANR